VDYSLGLQQGTYVDSANPTAAEIQTVVDSVNAAAVASAGASITKAIAKTASAPSSADMNMIPGVSGALLNVDYSLGLQKGTYVDAANPTAAEIQTVVDSINAAGVASAGAAVAEAIAKTASAPSSDDMNMIPGVSGALPSVDYSLGLQQGAYVDPANPTPAEIQTVIDSVNAATGTGAVADVAKAIAKIVSAPSSDAINLIIGVSGALPNVDYTSGLQSGTYVDPANPTSAEIKNRG